MLPTTLPQDHLVFFGREFEGEHGRVVLEWVGGGGCELEWLLASYFDQIKMPPYPLAFSVWISPRKR